ncbi:MAG: hypothetical protein H7321_08830 [Bacteroidia bacterium]|nr:hypothetical protein [Bacteroidia bacterium]
MFNKIWSYLTFKPQPKVDGQENNKNLKLMHGINRISIFMGLFALIVVIVKILKHL